MTESTDIHISSLVIQTTPGKSVPVSKDVSSLNGVEVVHLDSEKSKVIAVLESNSTAAIKEKIDAIESVDGVLCAALVYHHSESSHSLNEVLL